MITELILRLMSLVLSKQGFAFLVGGIFFSFLMHNSVNYALFITIVNDYVVQVVYNILHIGAQA
jgi:hypothetical protein